MNLWFIDLLFIYYHFNHLKEIAKIGSYRCRMLQCLHISLPCHQISNKPSDLNPCLWNKTQVATIPVQKSTIFYHWMINTGQFLQLCPPEESVISNIYCGRGSRTFAQMSKIRQLKGNDFEQRVRDVGLTLLFVYFLWMLPINGRGLGPGGRLYLASLNNSLYRVALPTVNPVTAKPS